MKDSRTSRDRRYGASVQTRAGTLWNASGNGNAAGAALDESS
jgi:hypothetical protein